MAILSGNGEELLCSRMYLPLQERFYSFYLFPDYEDRRLQWIAAAGSKNLFSLRVLGYM